MEDTKQKSLAVTLGLKDLSLIDRARALCVAADDVQRATIEATHRIAAIHGSSNSSLKKRKRRNNNANQNLGKEPPPDICARPPVDTPPPRGEGWRRLDPVSVVRGSNRICAPAWCRRALTRGVEVFLGGDEYCIVPADIDPGGGFCVTLNRDFEGESNMACMLYLRRKARETAATGEGKEGQERDITPTRKVKSPRSTYPSLSTPVPALEEQRLSTGVEGPLRMFTAGKEQEIGIFDRLRQNKEEGDNSSPVREARQRARQRAINQRKREIAAAKAKEYDERSTKDPLNAADIERLKATRRAALARVMSVKKQEACRRESQSKKIDEERRRKDAETIAKTTALQATAFARAAKAAEANRQRKLEQDLGRQEKARLKRERVEAVLNHDQSNVSEREKRVRNETCRRIRREERRQELALRREEDERLEKIRLHEERQRLAARCTFPAAKSARSFSSVSDPTDREAISSEIHDEDSGPTTTSASRPPDDESSSQRPVKTNHCGTFSETRDTKVNAFILDPSMGGTEVHRGRANQSCYDHDRERPSPPSSTEHTHSTTHYYSSDGATELKRYSDASKDGLKAGKADGAVRTPGLELTSTLPPYGTGSASASGTSVGSNGSNNSRRKKIPTKPVWKRPAVPLSKPYVPVPRKEGMFA